MIRVEIRGDSSKETMRVSIAIDNQSFAIEGEVPVNIAWKIKHRLESWNYDGIATRMVDVLPEDAENILAVYDLLKDRL